MVWISNYNEEERGVSVSSAYKGVDLFGSGPHRFAQSRQGQLVVPDFQVDLPGPGSYPYGLIELDVIVTGRLVASSDAALWVLRDAVVAQLQEVPTPGTLVDGHGHAWEGVSFIRYEEDDRVDRGRVVSIGYVATFRRFRQLLSSEPIGEAAEAQGGVGGSMNEGGG